MNICQKVQHFRADSEYLGNINTMKKNFNFFFQYLALPKDPQSFGYYYPLIIQDKIDLLPSKQAKQNIFQNHSIRSTSNQGTKFSLWRIDNKYE